MSADTDQYQLFPSLQINEYNRLKDDISENGVLVPVELDEHGNILDGHHRIKIWNELKSEGIKLKDYPRLIRGGMTEDEKINHVRRLNLLRRHLSNEDRKPHLLKLLETNTIENVAKETRIPKSTIHRITGDELSHLGKLTGKDGKKRPRKYKKRTTVFVKNKTQENKTTDNLQLVNPGGTLEFRQLDRKASTYKRESEIAKLREDLPDKTERYELHKKSCKEMADVLEPESVDIIITDPPYPYEFIDTYSELSETASIVLKPGGSCLFMSGQSYLPEVIKRISEHLKYHWMLGIIMSGGHTNIHARKLATGWKPVIWFTKGISNNSYIGNDVFKSTGNDKTKHYWGQNYDAFSGIVKAFCKPGYKIFDPFCGGGTTGLAAINNECYFIGSDIDSDSIKTTKNRINEN